MTILELVRQGLHFAAKYRSLWLFGFFVGLASGGSNGGGNSHGDGTAGGAAAVGGLISLAAAEFVWIALVIAVVAAVGVILRFVGEGALIEGVVRARRGRAMTTREGFRAGWAHWGVLFRIGLLYFVAVAGSVALLAAPCVLAFRAFGPVGGVLLALPALVVAVPWLITLALVQAFAFRIAVVEERRAVDAVRKARLFLHGRLVHGLKLMVATFVGSLGIGLASAVVLVPIALIFLALIPFFSAVTVIVIGGLLLVPAICVLTAFLGTFRSSVWTIGYLSQVES